MSNLSLDNLFEGFGPSQNIVSDLTVTGTFLPQLVLGSRGFEIKHARETKPLLDAQRRPLTSVTIVIVGVSPYVSRAYYAEEYRPSAADQTPDCASDDGIKPNAGVRDPQSEVCSECPMNQWGSANRAGSRAKACREVKRLVIVPVADLECRAYGAPLLFAVPPASHASLDTLYRSLRVIRWPEWAVAVQMEYDLTKSYPAVTFAIDRRLEMQELAMTRRLMKTFHTRIARSFGMDAEDYELPACPQPVEAAADALPPLTSDPSVVQAGNPMLAAPAPAAKPAAKAASRPAPERTPAAKLAVKAASRPAPEPAPAPSPAPSDEDPWVDEDDEETVDQVFDALRAKK